MLNKIQKYLLLHHPLLWNMRIVPVLAFTILINILVFLIGYSITKIDFTDTYYYSHYLDSVTLYFSLGLISVLTIIIWLIFYSKNNAFKSFYPQKSKSLYQEWLLIYFILFTAILPFFIVNIGSSMRVQSYASKSETIKAIETLNMVRILIPTDKTSYYKQYPDEHQVVSKNRAMAINLDSVITSAEQQNIEYADYPNFLQLSLLNYEGGRSIYINDDYGLNLKDVDTVKKWLVKEDKEAISHLMDDFLQLHKKHGLKTNLTKEKWMKLVYNPVKYPVGDFNLIGNSAYDSDSYKSYGNRNHSGYYLQFEELRSAYERMFDVHMEPLFNPSALLIVLCISGGLSLLIFSYRVTSGKSWLIAFVSICILLFINLLLSLTTGIFMYVITLLVLFTVLLVNVLQRNRNMQNKGRSNIYMNHLLWFIPAVPVMLFSLLFISLSDSCYSSGYLDDIAVKTSWGCNWYRFMDDNIVGFIYGNIGLTFITMWLFVRYVLLRWKSLPEE